MRAIPITVTALAAALLLTSCSDGGDGGDQSSDSTAGSGGTVCSIDQFDTQVAAGAAPAAGDTGNVTVTLTNSGSECTIEGFPGIDLNAADTSTSVSPEEGAKSRKLTLTKDAIATFTITYVRGEAGGEASLDVKSFNVALPGGGEDKNFKWSYGPVQTEDGNQGAANASVSAFAQAGD